MRRDDESDELRPQITECSGNRREVNRLSAAAVGIQRRMANAYIRTASRNPRGWNGFSASEKTTSTRHPMVFQALPMWPNSSGRGEV